MQGVGFAIVAAVTAGLVFRWSALAYPDSSGLALRSLSSILLACCASTFQLILCEVLQAGDPSTRVFLWKFNTAALLIILGLVAPAVQIYRVFALKFPRLKLFALVVFCVYLFVFQFSSTQLPIERYVDDANIYALNDKSMFDLRQDSLACISFVGITTMALLCGISSVTAPYSAFFYRPQKTTDLDVARLGRSVTSISELIASKELEISRMRLDIQRSRSQDSSQASALNGGSGTTGAGVSGGDLLRAQQLAHKATSSSTSPASTPSSTSSSVSTFMQRLVNMVRTTDNKQVELKSLLLELDALQKLKIEVEADLDAAKQRVERQKYYGTLLGRFHSLVFAIFALYCIYRVGNSYLRMGWWFFSSKSDPETNGSNAAAEGQPHTGPRDALVLLIASLIHRVIPDLDVQQWSRIIGVFMSGAVFAAAINGVLRTALRIVRHFNKTSSRALATMPLDVLFVGQIVGVYVLSIATTLRFNLPRSMSGPIMQAVVSPLKVSSVQLWNDIVLCGTSTIVIVLLIATNKLESEELMFDEEAAIVKTE